MKDIKYLTVDLSPTVINDFDKNEAG